MPKVPGASDSESQKKRKRQFGSNEPIPQKRRMLLSGVPSEIREVEGRKVMGIPEWPDTQVLSAIQQLKQVSHEQGAILANVQILAEVIENFKNELATVAQSGDEKPHLCQNEEERGRSRRKWYEFLKKVCVWGFISKSMREYRS